MEQELQLQQDEEEEEEEMRETGIYTFLRRPAVVYPMVCPFASPLSPYHAYYLPAMIMSLRSTSGDLPSFYLTDPFARFFSKETLQIILSVAWSCAYIYLADREFAYPSILRGTVRHKYVAQIPPVSGANLAIC